MTKSKTSVDEMLAFLDEEEAENSSLLWRPPTQPKKTAKTRDKMETKLETNRGQTRDKVETKLETNRGQSGDISARKKGSTSKTRDKVETKPRTQLETKWRQTEDKVETNLSFSSLIGLQRKLVVLIFDSCVKNQSQFTAPLTIEFLSESSGSSRSSVKKTLQRLEKNSFVVREKFKNGRGGWTVYSLPKSVFQDLLHNQTRDKVETNRGQTRDKVESQLETEPRTSPSSSSSSFNNNSTTTSDELWKTLDLSSVEVFGINQSAIFEARQKFGPFSFVDFEKFLERFGKFMSDNKKSKSIGNARGFFFSLCKQIREGIEPLSEIKTDSDEALALLLKLKKEEKRKREEVERELMSFEFDEWFDGLSENEKDAISPPTELLKKGSGPYRAVFRSHFEENLWPQIREEMVK